MAASEKQERATFLNDVSGDERLGLSAKIRYWGQNLRNNLVPSLAARELEIETFEVEEPRRSVLLAAADLTRSPARALSECFLRSFDWAGAHGKFGDLHVVDAGCGDGSFARKLVDFSAGIVRSYVGFDIRERPNWQQLRASNVKLVQARAEEFQAHVPGETNFFFSHSALEHFEYDLSFLEAIRDLIIESGKPTLQIHFVPAPSGLALYAFHGYRQYPKRALRRICEVFSGTDWAMRIVAIGGWRSVSLHLRSITLPSLRGRGGSIDENYRHELQRVLESELQRARGPACYYALVIETAPRTRG